MKSKQRGSFSMYGLLAMSVILLGSLGVSAYSVNSMARATREANAVAAFEAAQAGLEQSITTAYKNLQANNGVFVTTNTNLSTPLATIANSGTVTTNVAPNADATYAWVTSTSTVNGVSRSVRGLIKAKNVGIWNNAIFAGTGATGHAINGNVDIRGSIHILGDGEPYIDLNGNGKRDSAEAFVDKVPKNGVWDPGETFTDSNGDGVYTAAEPYNDSNGNGAYDPPLTQTDMDTSFGGSAYVGNNYSGMPAALEAMVPAAPRISGIETLSTEVRVKHGLIGISGSATVGASGSIDGGTSKATVDGMYVTDGYTGNKGAASVYSDNGTTNTYDIGGLGIEFPYINGIGSDTYIAKDGTSWTDQETYLNAKSLLCPVNTITASTTAFSYGPDANGNSISFTPASGSTPATLTTNGIIRFTGDLQLGHKDSISYKGNGTLYATQDLYIDGNLLPAAGQTFPTTARMGFIAKRNMLLASGAGSSQLSMAGAFYAQGKIYSAKQNQIAGTFVANFFDMGTNVPNIYQVPSLPFNMPPGMPGDKGYYTLKIKSWRERKVTGG